MSGAARAWDEALAEGHLMLQRPVGGGSPVFPPRELAPGTGGPLEWFEASGRGTVYSVTWVRKKPPEPSYNVVLVDLEEGARMMGRVEGVTEDTLRIGMPVRARIAEGTLVVFDIDEGGQD